MAIIRLVPSVLYNAAGTSYLTISNQANAFTNTDSTNYATVDNTYSSTTNRYIYLRGFNFDDIPSGAIVNGFTIKLKANESGISTSTSYKPYLANGTNIINGSCDPITTSVTTHTFSGLSDDWENIKEYGANFGIRINCRRASRNTTGHVYIYGAEIEVDYTIPDPCTITTTLSGNGTISPNGATSTYKDVEFELTITPTDKSDSVTVTNNGVDVTAQLIAHGSDTSTSRVLGAFSLISGSFNSGQSYFEGLEGAGVDNTKTSSNYYSSSSSTQAIFQYDLGVSLPSNANIIRVYCEVNGHAESSSNSSEYMCVQLKSGSVELSEQINFKNVSTSNTTITLEAETLPTVAQLANMVMECKLGYYGGAINGATCYVEYDISGGAVDHYTYSFTTTGDAIIAVVIGGSQGETEIYLKVNGAWVKATTVYKKVNGAWVQQTDLTNIFDSTQNYRNVSL